MKRFFSVLGRILPHAVLILGVMMLVFFCIDLVNSSMAFLNNSVTKWLLAVFAVLSSVLAVCYVLKEEKKH